jgi:hypothetical protein
LKLPTDDSAAGCLHEGVHPEANERHRRGDDPRSHGDDSFYGIPSDGTDFEPDEGRDDINFERNQFGRESAEPLELSLGISVFDHDVAPLDVTEVTQSLTEGLWQVGARGHVVRQVAYSRDPVRLLRLGGERRGEEAAGDAHDERSPVHYSIT